MALFDYSIFRTKINQFDIFINRKFVKPHTLGILIILLITFPALLVFLLFGIISGRVKVIILGSIAVFVWLFAILFLLLKWNYFSAYPSSVQISLGKISARFRRLFHTDDFVNITLEDHPFLTIDFELIRPFSIQEYCAQITLHSMNKRPVLIYYKLDYLKEDAVKKARDFSELVATKSNMFPNEKIYFHT
jgi:hypothetical protein